MSDLRRFDANGDTHINGHYCDANEAMKLIEQQAAEIEALKAYVEYLKEHLDSPFHHHEGDFYYTLSCKHCGEDLGSKIADHKQHRETCKEIPFNKIPQQSLAERDAEVIGNLKFPTMLRKMWSGGEVQEWLNQEAERIKRGFKSSR